MTSETEDAEWLKDSIRSLWNHRTLCDVVLECRSGNVIEAHRLVLAAESPYLRTLVDSDHGQQCNIPLDISNGALIAFVKYLYHIECKVQPEEALELLKVAQEFDLQRLREKVIGLLWEDLDEMHRQVRLLRCQVGENGNPIIVQVNPNPGDGFDTNEEHGSTYVPDSHMPTLDDIPYSSYTSSDTLDEHTPYSAYTSIDNFDPLETVESLASEVHSDPRPELEFPKPESQPSFMDRRYPQLGDSFFSVPGREYEHPAQIRSSSWSHPRSEPTTEAKNPTSNSPPCRTPRSDEFDSDSSASTVVQVQFQSIDVSTVFEKDASSSDTTVQVQSESIDVATVFEKEESSSDSSTGTAIQAGQSAPAGEPADRKMATVLSPPSSDSSTGTTVHTGQSAPAGEPEDRTMATVLFSTSSSSSTGAAGQSVPAEELEGRTAAGQSMPDEDRTTLLIRNIGNQASQEQLLDLWPVAIGYDLFYLPYSIKRKRNLGFAFINFRDTVTAENFRDAWQGYQMKENSNKQLCISWAEVQGFERHLEIISQYSEDLWRMMSFIPIILGKSDQFEIRPYGRSREVTDSAEDDTNTQESTPWSASVIRK